MKQQVVWLVGDSRQPGFAEPLAWLRSAVECHLFALPRYALVAAAIGREPPDAVVFLQAHPGAISPGDIELLKAALQRAKIVALAGPWCEGERRANWQAAGIVHVPWRSWRWRLPGAVGCDSCERPGRRKPLAALILTGRRNLYESLADSLKQSGAASVWRETASARQAAAANVVVCDGWDEAEKCDTKRPRLVLLHFPRPADERRAADEGNSTIVSMPFVRADLVAALDLVWRGRK